MDLPQYLLALLRFLVTQTNQSRKRCLLEPLYMHPALWAKSWKVKFGAEKLRTVIFTNKTPQVSPPILLNSDYIKQVEMHKHLGLLLTI